MKTYIYSVITIQLSLLTLIILVTKNKALQKANKTGFIVASFMIMVCAFAECLGALLDGSNYILRVPHMIIKYLELCLTPCVPLVLATVFPSVRYRKFFYIPDLVHILLQTLSLFLGFIFYIDEQNIYRHGKLYWIYYVFVFVNIAFISFTTVKFGAKLQNRNHASLFMILLFILAGTVFQIIDSNVKIVWLTVAIGVILFYIYYCNMVYQVDYLTLLLNRRAYDVHKLSLKSKAYILVLDVNDFKNINDVYGHSAGDLCLKNIASAMKAIYGKHGLCYRTGGDEFCIILDRKIHFCNVEKLNKDFRSRISEKNGNNIISSSIAIGYALFEPGKAKISDVVKNADELMYLDKNQAKKYSN